MNNNLVKKPLHDLLGKPLQISLGESLWNPLRDSLRNSIRNSIGGLLELYQPLGESIHGSLQVSLQDADSL